MEWAEQNSRREGASIKKPGVLGAVFDLGKCLDLTDSECLNQLIVPYETLVKTIELSGIPLPHNEDPVPKGDRILRKLDCAVIETLHELTRDAGLPAYDSVKGVF